MNLKKKLKSLAAVFSFLSAGLGALHFYRAKSTPGTLLSVPKMVAGAFSPFLALMGSVGSILGAILGAPLTAVAGALGALLSGQYLGRVLARHGGFERAFGDDWKARIPSQKRERMLPRRWQLGLPEVPQPRWERDIPFWVIPGTDRELLCDLWRPPLDVEPSGLAFVYLHGSGWHFVDKDVGTRPMFQHLAAQGHVVMDIAYRLCPEVQWREMAGDPKRAVAWMKARAPEYGVDPDHVVLAGGSAGGHLALLSAYAPYHPELTPEDVRDKDLSVCGVVSWYGPSDMYLYYAYGGTPFGMLVGASADDPSSQLMDRMTEAFGFEMKMPEDWGPEQTVQEAMMHGLMGGSPEEVPDAYKVFSPVQHIGPHCPPTLFLHGGHDSIVSIEGVHVMAQMLEATGVPVVYVPYPQTEHAFDLILPQISPSAQAALYEVDRFLALLSSDG